jgi:hypothetical protein
VLAEDKDNDLVRLLPIEARRPESPFHLGRHLEILADPRTVLQEGVEIGLVDDQELGLLRDLQRGIVTLTKEEGALAEEVAGLETVDLAPDALGIHADHAELAAKEEVTGGPWLTLLEDETTSGIAVLVRQLSNRFKIATLKRRKEPGLPELMDKPVDHAAPPSWRHCSIFLTQRKGNLVRRVGRMTDSSRIARMDE